jgi:PAS domain S-box-containing protein
MHAAHYFRPKLVRGCPASKRLARVTTSSEHVPETLWEDGELILSRRERDGEPFPLLVAMPSSAQPSPETLARLQHAYALREELDPAWAARPLRLEPHQGRLSLLIEDPGGEPLERLLGEPMETGRFLRLAIDIAAALGRAHQRGLVHKDVKPVNILVNCADGGVRLTGFGVASRLPRQRQAPEPPEIIAGTLAYMAPEQTGRMNRSIDSRSDLYALGVTFYRMLTGRLPFTAADPMEWVHCHIARKPTPPAERLPAIPALISDIVLKLLAKPAEERHQTAAGLEHDLRHCLEQWEAHGRIEAFSLGERDTPNRLVVPEKLYGREPEVEALLAAFDRVVRGGRPELVLVSGYSGVGKSSVVNEVHKALVPSRGLFASGKFDQLKRDIPYATLVQALQSLIRPLLSRSEAELASWREAFQEAVGPNGGLIVDLVPELRLVVGEPPPVPELEPQQAQSRFQLTMRRFIGVFARPAQPLALFLDDLQWLDAATLDLIEDVLTQPDVRDLILIGAYRDNDVDATHPLARKLEGIRSSGAKVSEIQLAPLQLEHVRQLIADALHCDPVLLAPLAHLVYARTDGNPFFAIQFLHAFADEGLVAFDPEAQRWKWDLQRIHAKGYADNVVDLMVGKLARLPSGTQKALQELACLGAVADITTLSTVFETSETEVHSALQDALRAELIERLSSAYKFVHDRVQEAAYSSIPEHQRAARHLVIGRRLVSHTPPAKREEMIFDIVGQLNRGSGLIVSVDERNQLAELNLIAGKRAKASTAHHSALTYLAAGAALLQEDAWNDRHDLIFQLELQRAECEFLTGALAKSEERLAEISQRAANTLERAAIARLRINLYTAIDRPGQAIAVCLDYLRQEGIDWSAHPTEEEVRREYERIWSQVGSRSIEELIDLPLMGDQGWQATMDVLTPLLPAALFSDQQLFSLVVARMANVSLEHGHTDGSCLAYVWLGLLLGPSFNNYPAAFAFGQLGLHLMEKRGLNRFRARVLLDFSHVVNPWMQHARVGPGLVRRAFDAAYEVGDLTFAGYSCWNMVSALMATGAPLSEVQREAEKQLAFVLKLRFGLIIEVITGQLRLILAMRGLTPSFSSFDGPDFDEHRFEHRLDDDPAMAPAIGWYGVRKLQGRFLAGDYRGALAAADKVERVLWTMLSHLEVAEYHFYAALAKAACYATAPSHDQPLLLRAIGAHYKQIGSWAEHCPENFENRAALVGAEIARIEGRDLDAQGLYEQAIRSARAHGFVHNEALAYELAACFYLARGFEEFAHVYLQNARYGYLRWGADGKVRQIDEMYPHLRAQEPPPRQTGTIEAAIEQLDVATVIKASQAVSGEIMLDKLLDTLMRAALEHAGAGRGLMILLRGDERRIAAEAITRGDTVTVQLRDETATAAGLPASVLHYVLRTQETVILDDVAAENAFSADTYLREKQPRSILCLPLINQAKLIGVLYLENELASHVFAPARVVALKLLASQAAISLENSRLYRDLQERETKIRRLVDANVVGIFIGDFDGRILEANDAFLRIVGYDRGDLAAGHINWTALTPLDWRERDPKWVLEHKSIGLRPPIEKEYLRKDGRRVPIMLGSATLEDSGNQIVTFVVDLTERKAAEEAQRESEERFRTLMQFSFEVYWETDAQYRFVRQEFSERLSDAPPGDSELGKTRWEVPYLEPDEDAWRRHRETLDAHLPFRDFELARPTPIGGKRYLSVSGLPVFDKAGRFNGYRGVARDITERKRASEALREAQMQLAHANRVATMGQLTASIAHEVNQPIAATVLNAETGLRWLGAEPPDVDEARQAFDDIMRDGNRAAAVVERIRNLSKKALPRDEHVEINGAIREVIELTRSEAMKNGVSTQTELVEGLPLVHGDRVELQQVILNLILNAIEAMSETSEEPRELLITTERAESGDLLVAVRDSGPGLAPGALENLFKAFHTTKPNGLGLGLSICRSIIEACGGRLWASANAPRGAVFQFTLPAHRDIALPQ